MLRPERVALVVALLQFSLIPGPTVGQTDCAASSHTVYRQAELDNLLSDCGDAGSFIRGDLRVGSTLSGSLQISNVGAIAGSIIIEDNEFLESLQLESDLGEVSLLDGSTPGLILRNLANLTEVTGGAKSTFTTVEIRDVPSLETVDLPNLSPAQNLRLINATRLETFNFGPKYSIAGTIELRDVGLGDLDDFFRGGLPGQNISTSGELDLHFLQYGLVDAMNVSIAINGALEFYFRAASTIFDEGDPPTETHVEYLQILANVGDFGTPEADDAIKPSVDTFVMRDTSIFRPYLHFKDLKNLVLHNNPLLTAIVHDASYANYSWKSISILNNEYFVPKLDERDGPSGITADWTLPSEPLETFELLGPVNEDIFTEWIERGKQSDEPLVTKKFMVESTRRIDCSPLNDLHKKGVLQGEYSCSRAGRGVQRASILVVVAVLSFFLA